MQKKILAINGSPRKYWNTYQLCESALKGASSIGAETELIQLCDIKFSGCMSCYVCHKKGMRKEFDCFYKDALSPLLKKCLQADAIIVGSPIYYGDITGTVHNFLERLLFPIDTYAIEKGVRLKKLDKVIPSALIFTMNANEKQAKDMKKILQHDVDCMNHLLGYCESLYSFDTYQFSNYEEYDANLFDEKHKLELNKKQFPLDLEKAYGLGKRLIIKADELNDKRRVL